MASFCVYGIEYAVNIRPDKKITIATVRDLDARLLSSQYYQRRKSYYKENMFKSWCVKVDKQDIDFHLRYDEEVRLNEVLAVFGSDVYDHGWYDVGYLADTYEAAKLF